MDCARKDRPPWTDAGARRAPARRQRPNLSPLCLGRTRNPSAVERLLWAGEQHPELIAALSDKSRWPDEAAADLALD